MTTKDAIESINRSTEATMKAVVGIEKTFVAMNDNLVYHRELTKENRDGIQKISETLDRFSETLDRTAKLLDQKDKIIEKKDKMVRYVVYALLGAIIILAGVEKGVKVWNLLKF